MHSNCRKDPSSSRNPVRLNKAATLEDRAAAAMALMGHLEFKPDAVVMVSMAGDTARVFAGRGLLWLGAAIDGIVAVASGPPPYDYDVGKVLVALRSMRRRK